MRKINFRVLVLHHTIMPSWRSHVKPVHSSTYFSTSLKIKCRESGRGHLFLPRKEREERRLFDLIVHAFSIFFCIITMVEEVVIDRSVFKELEALIPISPEARLGLRHFRHKKLVSLRPRLWDALPHSLTRVSYSVIICAERIGKPKSWHLHHPSFTRVETSIIKSC
ncbi:unnamed protein product [Moneuplotes crassus]|uniref:Uncharacterized protein n=1 Tax=Euplotes crassus TaxID=5936 RepID=A0AAD1XJE0_EUPCR|nr:unnamed protein product [Moneuplotes crassus]